MGANETQLSIHEDGQDGQDGLFIFSGTIESISNAKVQLEYHLERLKVIYRFPWKFSESLMEMETIDVSAIVFHINPFEYGFLGS